MATSMAYLSVFCKRSETAVHPKTITFSEIVSKLDKIPEETVVEKILISKSEKIVDPAHIVSLDTPVIVCEQFGCFNVCIVLQPQAAVAPTAGRLWCVIETQYASTVVWVRNLS